MLKNLKLIDSKFSIVNKVGMLTFCRNDIRNALTGSCIINDIINTVEYINKNNTVSVLIITGEGKAFSSGGNIKEMLNKNTPFSGPVEEVEKKLRLFVVIVGDGAACASGFTLRWAYSKRNAKALRMLLCRSCTRLFILARSTSVPAHSATSGSVGSF